ncbi:hypothetical protein [Actinoplanes sp. NPDC051851]|uniref:hypothetical protein n=1 Tax=Actinoplanes sp. NPDC051851 TaxID=3154753 RepID=UPI00343B2832
MNKAQRFLAIAGMGVAAGAMIGIGPVQAAPRSGAHWGDYVAGTFRTERACERAGWTGIDNGAWYDYDCEPTYWGPRGRVYQLVVAGDDWGWDDWGGSWPSGWPYRPDYPGKRFHIPDGPGRDRDHGPGRDDHGPGRDDHGPGRDDHCPGRDDHGPGRDDHGPGRDDHGPGRDDHGPGRDDHGPGRDDHGPGRDDHGPGRDDHGPRSGPRGQAAWPQP